MAIEQFLYTHPVFRYEEFATIKSQQGTESPVAIKVALQYYLKSQRIKTIKRGLFAVVPPNETAESAQIDPYLIAGKAAKDSILAYHTALELHGIAYSTFQKFTFITKQKIKPFNYQDQQYQPVSIPTALKNNTTENIGVDVIDRQGLQIKITTLGRTFVDVLARVELSGGWEEVYRSINNIGALNIDEVIVYCLRLDNPTIAAKTGLFLEQRQGAFAVNDAYLKKLLILRPKWPIYITRARREACRYVKKWNLMVPEKILNQNWEEPNHDI